MDIRNIRAFVRVAELKSFSKAAAELDYVQSTVTMQVRQLEQELGYPLFDRIGKRVSLTAMGAEFLTCAYEILHAVGKAESLGREMGNAGGVLRVGVLESLLFGAMQDLLPGFRSSYPQVELQLKMGQTTELLQKLKENELDMVYLSAGLNTDPDLRCCYRRQENLVFLAGPSHPLASKEHVSVSELMEYDFVVTERSGICYGRLRELAARHNAMLHDPVEVDSTAVIARLVRSGMGLAFLPEYAVADHLAAGSLVKLDVELEPQIYHSQILCHKNRWISPFMEALIAHIRKARPEQGNRRD